MLEQYTVHLMSSFAKTLKCCMAYPSVLFFSLRSIDCKTQLESSNKNTLEPNTKIEPESALASQVSAQCVTDAGTNHH